MAGLKLKHVYKVYNGGVRAVNDFNLDIKDKSFVVLVGPSGCGKSTTLRMIAGLETITSGQLYIDNVLVNDMESKNRDIAMVFQSYALYPHMTVYQNMGFSLKLRHEKAAVIKEKVLKAAEILEISDLLDRKPKELSGGQRQRVALGRAIVRNAKVFLMDEPLSNLDAKLRVQMRSEIIKLHESIGATTIYVTHDQTEAMTMASRIVVMKLGKVQQIGSPIEIYNHPANLFVAGFIGSPAMNFLKVKWDAKKHVATTADGKEIAIPAELVKGYEIPENAILGIRPEDIHPSERAAENTFDITVNVAELLGHEYYIHTDFGGADLISKFPAKKAIAVRDELKISFDVKKVHFFDPETENAIF